MPTIKPPRVNKWLKEYIIQEYTGALYGWEDSTTEETIKAAREQLKLYRKNAGVPVRLITRRVLNPEWKETQS